MKKMTILLIIAFLFAFVFTLTKTTLADSEYKKAQICKDCHKANNGIKCIKCGKVSANNKDYLTVKCCNSCMKNRKCTQCGKKYGLFSDVYDAHICRSCEEALKEDENGMHCIQCGKRIYPRR